jgi:hypothetical protein
LLLLQLQTLTALLLLLLLLLCHTLLPRLLKEYLARALLLPPASLKHALLVPHLPPLHGLPALHLQLWCHRVQDKQHTADCLLQL